MYTYLIKDGFIKAELFSLNKIISTLVHIKFSTGTETLFDNVLDG